MKKVFSLLEEMAVYAYENRECGYTVAREFQTALNQSCKVIASAPLQNSHDWGNPQRRAFFDYRGQYTLIFVFAPPTAETNPQVDRIIFSDIYPSHSNTANQSKRPEKNFDANDLLKD